MEVLKVPLKILDVENILNIVHYSKKVFEYFSNVIRKTEFGNDIRNKRLLIHYV